MSADKTDRGYDTAQRPDANARADVQRVGDDLATKGAEQALTRLYDEADPSKGLAKVDAATQQQYRAEYTKQLTDANILPALSIAAVKGLGDQVKTEGAVDPAKVIARMQGETDPVRKALLSNFVSQYDQMRRETPGGKITDQVLQAKLDKTTKDAQENVALKAKQEKDRGDLGDLVRNPELFKAISSKPDGGSITKDDAEAFRKRITEGTTPEDAALREKFAGTPEADAKLKKTLDSLIKSFDSPENQPGKKGSTIKGGGLFETRWDNFMTPDSLSKGMGFETPAKGKEALDKNVKPISNVEAVTSYDGTRLAPGKGPQDLAQRMLPDGEGKHFKDKAALDTARGDLAYVFRKGGGILKDNGKPEVNAENRDQVVEALRAREKARAAATGQPEDNTLSNWFASKYPKLEAAPAAAQPAVEATKDYKNSGVGGQGSWGITENVTKGQNLPADAKSELQKILGNKAITGVDIMSAREGTPVITEANLQKIREAVDASKSAALKAWFAKRYPKA